MSAERETARQVEADGERFRSAPSELQRIETAGQIWSAAEMIGAAVFSAAVVSGGWRPSTLQPDAAVAWWAGAILCVSGLVATVWAGCPVIGPSLEQDDRRKSVSIRAGLAAYGIGGLALTIAMLTGAA